MGIRITGERFYWPNGRIPFEMDGALPAAGVTAINNAIANWNTNTVVRLTPHDGEGSFVVFTGATSRCESPVGMRGGRQEVRCDLGTFNATSIVHEIGHAAGLWHEQSREDRNSFVTIRTDNIISTHLHNFAQHIVDGDDIGNYDYNSIMHYHDRAFAIDPSRPTIIAPQPIGVGSGLSANDIDTIELTYRGRADWTWMLGKLKYVSTAATPVQWGVNSADDIFRRNGNTWDHIAGKLKQVSVGPDGTVWGVNSVDDIFRWTGNTWEHIAGKLKHVAVGSAGSIWGVNSADDIFRRNGNDWDHIDGKLKQVSVGSDGTVWGVNSADDIFRRNGNTWEHIAGKLKHVAVGSANSIWGVNSADDIFRRDGNTWDHIVGKLKQISVASDGTIWGVNSNDDIFRR